MCKGINTNNMDLSTMYLYNMDLSNINIYNVVSNEINNYNFDYYFSNNIYL